MVKPLTLKAPIRTAADDKFSTKIRHDISWKSSASRRFSWNIIPNLLFLKKPQNFNLSSAANYRWRFRDNMGLDARHLHGFWPCKDQTTQLSYREYLEYWIFAWSMFDYYNFQIANFFVCLIDLILYVPSTIFQLNRDGSSWVEPVLS